MRGNSFFFKVSKLTSQTKVEFPGNCAENTNFGAQITFLTLFPLSFSLRVSVSITMKKEGRGEEVGLLFTSAGLSLSWGLGDIVIVFTPHNN